MLVEDDPNDILLTKRAFRKHIANDGHSLIVVKNGKEAIDYLNNEQLPHLILLDLNLPIINGFEVMEYIRSEEHTKLIPVIILSSSNEKKDISRIYKLGANSYIQKPVNIKEFYRVVDLIHKYWIQLNQNPKFQFNN